jgi:hypothetical protein
MAVPPPNHSPCYPASNARYRTSRQALQRRRRARHGMVVPFPPPFYSFPKLFSVINKYMTGGTRCQIFNHFKIVSVINKTLTVGPSCQNLSKTCKIHNQFILNQKNANDLSKCSEK